jgi:hypothetical protein
MFTNFLRRPIGAGIAGGTIIAAISYLLYRPPIYFILPTIFSFTLGSGLVGNRQIRSARTSSGLIVVSLIAGGLAFFSWKTLLGKGIWSQKLSVDNYFFILGVSMTILASICTGGAFAITVEDIVRATCFFRFVAVLCFFLVLFIPIRLMKYSRPMHMRISPVFTRSVLVENGGI